MLAQTDGADLAPLTLYFGCDDPDLDVLHRAELEAAVAAGMVTLRPAFSERPIDGVRFARHALARDADAVWSALQAGGRVLVCGDARRLAPGVRDVLQQLHRDRTGGDHERAQAWLAGSEPRRPLRRGRLRRLRASPESRSSLDLRGSTDPP
jgi:cytochrome P450/NADPH-cytochrome P450 reductase